MKRHEYEGADNERSYLDSGGRGRDKHPLGDEKKMTASQTVMAIAF